jgi:hypothetical protein
MATDRAAKYRGFRTQYGLAGSAEALRVLLNASDRDRAALGLRWVISTTPRATRCDWVQTGTDSCWISLIVGARSATLFEYVSERYLDLVVRI